MGTCLTLVGRDESIVEGPLQVVNIEDTIGFVVCDAVTFVFELVVAYEYMVPASLVETKLLP